MMIKTKNQMTDCQDVQVEDSPEEFDTNLNIHETQIFGDLSGPWNSQHSTIMYCQTLLFILNVPLITQAEVAWVWGKKIYI